MYNNKPKLTFYCLKRIHYSDHYFVIEFECKHIDLY